MQLTIETCADALNQAAMNRKAAMQIELAVGLAVFHLHGSTGKEGRVMLVNAYAAAGYRCQHINEMDYKTINRRVNATAALFEALPVSKWVGKLHDNDAIRAICRGIEPYELYTIADVMRYCQRPGAVASRKVHAVTRVQPHMQILDPAPGEPYTEGPRFRRAVDQYKHVTTEHLTVAIPDDTPKWEIIELAMQLLAMTKEKNKELLTA